MDENDFMLVMLAICVVAFVLLLVWRALGNLEKNINLRLLGFMERQITTLEKVTGVLESRIPEEIFAEHITFLEHDEQNIKLVFMQEADAGRKALACSVILPKNFFAEANIDKIRAKLIESALQTPTEADIGAVRGKA